MREAEWSRAERLVLFFYFYFLSLPSSIYGNRTVGILRGKNKKALLDEGYAWEQKIRDFVEFLIKNLENPMFWFFSDLWLSDDQNWSEHEAFDPRIASYAWVPKYWSFVKLHEVWI